MCLKPFFLFHKEPKDKWWQRICYDNPSALLNCLPDEEIMVSAAIYGNLACMSGTRLSGFPNCGKYVTETLTNVCNRKETCAITVNSSTFGTTNCGGSENLFVDYECCEYLSYKFCLSNISVSKAYKKYISAVSFQ